MPDNPYDALFTPANPRERVHGIASKIGISPDIADDYLKVTNVESGHNIKVRDSAKGAQGFGQVMPDYAGATTRTISGRKYNLRDPDENIEAGLRLFSAGGPDPVGRRLEYFGGHRARKRYEQTGQIPNISDGNLTAQQYVQATGGQRTPKPTPNPYDALFASDNPQAAQAQSETAANDSPLSRMRTKYPWTRGIDINFIDSSAKGDPSRKLEFYPADERDNPQPGKPTIELFDKQMSESDLMGELLSHHLPSADKNIARFRGQVLDSMTPRQKQVIKGDYDSDRQSGLTNDSFDIWLTKQGGDAFFRGYPTGQWPARAYTSQQKAIYRQMQSYLNSTAPAPTAGDARQTAGADPYDTLFSSATPQTPTPSVPQKLTAYDAAWHFGMTPEQAQRLTRRQARVLREVVAEDERKRAMGQTIAPPSLEYQNEMRKRAGLAPLRFNVAPEIHIGNVTLRGSAPVQSGIAPYYQPTVSGALPNLNVPRIDVRSPTDRPFRLDQPDPRERMNSANYLQLKHQQEKIERDYPGAERANVAHMLHSDDELKQQAAQMTQTQLDLEKRRPEINAMKERFNDFASASTHKGRLAESVWNALATSGVQAANLARLASGGRVGNDVLDKMRLAQVALGELDQEDPNKGWIAAAERALPGAGFEASKMVLLGGVPGASRLVLPGLGALSEADKGVGATIKGAAEGELFHQGFGAMARAGLSPLTKFAAGTAIPAGISIAQGEDPKTALLSNAAFGVMALAEPKPARPLREAPDVIDRPSEAPISLPEDGKRPLAPESPATIQAQMDAMVNGRGNRYGVLIPKGQKAPTRIPKGSMATRTNEGVVIHPKELSSEDVREIVNDGNSWQLLGHQNPDTAEATRVVVARAGIEGRGGIKPGTELLSSYVVPGQEQNAIEEMRAQFAPYEPTFEVGGQETAAKAVEERQFGWRPGMPRPKPKTPGAEASSPAEVAPSRFEGLGNQELEQSIVSAREEAARFAAEASARPPKGTSRAERQSRQETLVRRQQEAENRIREATAEIERRRAGTETVPSLDSYLQTETGGKAGGVNPASLSAEEQAAYQKQYDDLFYPTPHHSRFQKRRQRGTGKGRFMPGMLNESSTAINAESAKVVLEARQQVASSSSPEIIQPVPAREPAVTPPAEIKTQPTATESQLTTREEVKDVTQEAAVVPSQSGNQPLETKSLTSAFADWRSRRAYIDGNGNYHLKTEGRSSGPIAPWNKDVKQAFKTVSEFHAAAHEPVEPEVSEAEEAQWRSQMEAPEVKQLDASKKFLRSRRAQRLLEEIENGPATEKALRQLQKLGRSYGLEDDVINEQARGQTLREAPAKTAVAENSVSTEKPKEATRPPLTVVPPPEHHSAEVKERSFPKTVESAGFRGGSDRDYSVLTNTESLDRAEKQIARVGVDRAAADLARTEDVGAPEIATGILLMRHYEQKGDINGAVNVAGDVARKLTQAGQTVQAASLISRLSPEGVLLHAQKILKGKPLPEEAAKTLVAQAKAVSDAEKLIAEIQKQRPDVFGPNGEILPRPSKSPRTSESRTAVPRSVRAKIGTLQDRLVSLEQQARERMQARAATAKTEVATLPPKGQRGAGISPAGVAADLGDLVIIGAAKLARKGMTQGVWLAEMAQEASALTRKDLRRLYRESYERYQQERRQFQRESRMRGAERQARGEKGTIEGPPTPSDLRQQGPLSPQEYSRIIAERAEAQKLAQRSYRELARTYQNLTRGRLQKIADTAVGLRRANLLTAVKTHLRNVTSNVGFTIISEESARPMAALADMVARRTKGTGLRTTAGLSIPSASKALYAAAVKEGPRRAVDIILGREVLPLEGYRSGAEGIASKMQLHEADSGFKILDTYINTVFRTLEAEDALFKVYAFRRELADIALSQARSEKASGANIRVSRKAKELQANPTDAMQMEAATYADYATFQNKNVVSSGISAFKRFTEPVGGKFLVEQIAPFDRTPTNIIARALENSPLGLISAVRKYKRIGTQAQAVADAISKEAFTRQEQKDFARTFGRASTGTALAALAMILVAKGLLSGAADYDSDREDYMKKRRKYGGGGMLRIPGTNQRVSIIDTPVGKSMATAASIYEQMKDPENTWGEAVTKSGRASLNTYLLDQPLIRGLRDLGDTKSVGEAAAQYGTTFVPGSQALKSISEVADDQPRTYRGQGAAAQFRTLIPGRYGRGGLPVDSGVDAEERGGLGRRALRAMDPFNTTTEGHGPRKRSESAGAGGWPMQQELDRLDITINAPQRVKPGKNEKFKAETEEEYDARRRQEAEAIKAALQRLEQMDSFKTLPDRSKEAAIRGTITAARESVRYREPAKRRQIEAFSH